MASAGGLDDLSVSEIEELAPFSSADLYRLFTFRRDDLLRFATTLTSDREVAEEAIHDAFLYTSNGVHRIENELHAYRFLKWKTRMLVYDKVGTSANARSVDIGEMESLEGPGIDPAESLERVEEEAIVRAALLRLSDRQRAVLVAKYFMDQSGQETAAQLGIGAGAQKQLLHRARQSFKESLTAVLRDKGISVNDFVSGFYKRVPKLLSFAVIVVMAMSSFGALSHLSQDQNLQILGSEERRTFLTPSPNSLAAQENLELSAVALPTKSEPASAPQGSGGQEVATLASAATGVSTPAAEDSASVEALTTGGGFDWAEHDLLAAYLESAMALVKPPEINELDGTSQYSVANGQIELRDGRDSSVFIGLSEDANQPVQYLSLVLEPDGFRFGLTPTTIFSTYSEATEGGRLIELGATDFIVGDLKGNFDFVTTSSSSWSSFYLFATVQIDREGEVLGLSTKFLERIP